MLSNNAEKIFKMKYAVDDKEDWLKASIRVADYVAQAEKNYEDGENMYDIFFPIFFQAIYEKKFIPGGRILANAGTNIKNLFNCFVLPINDSRDSIYTTLHDAAEIFAWGGGVGYNFSELREEGAPIRVTGGEASGPLSFMQLFDTTGEVIQQASRRGAQMGMLDIDHPDIEKFINFKSTLNVRNKRIMDEFLRNSVNENNPAIVKDLEKTLKDDQLTHFNISVVIPDAFMEAALEKKDWELISRFSGEPVTSVNADKLLSDIAEHAWTSGDPGIYFEDTANKDNLVVEEYGKVKATNPCITGDTKILTVYNGAVEIAKLAEKGEDVLVYSWNPVTKLPAVRTMHSPRKTAEDQEVLEVIFDSGLQVKCTYDHNFIGFRGEKIQAKDLVVGQSIRAFSMSIHRDGHLRTHGWVDGKTRHQYVARMIWEYYNGEIPPEMILHHKDFTELNNKLDNLELVTKDEHNRIHYPYRKKAGFYKHFNHKVVGINKLEALFDVYNGTVDGTHTYIIADDVPVSGIASGIVSANCGEIGLYPYESCNLASINLYEMLSDDKKTFDLDKLAFFTQLAIRFLDNVHDMSANISEKINETAFAFRRLGLGLMGWADVLAELEIQYDSLEAYSLIEVIGKTFAFNAWYCSKMLAEERGQFPASYDIKLNHKGFENVFDELKDADQGIIDEFLNNFKVRNVSVTAIAPNGTIAILADVNSAIEPYFALAYKRNITEGVGNTAKQTITEINPILFRKLQEYGFDDTFINKVKKVILKTGSIQHIQDIPEKLKTAFKTAHDIPWREHIITQALWQKYISNSISKTINMPEDCTVDDVKEAYKLAWQLGCKGVTIYRNNSKSFQILNVGK